MKTKEVRIDTSLNKFLWSKGVRNVREGADGCQTLAGLREARPRSRVRPRTLRCPSACACASRASATTTRTPRHVLAPLFERLQAGAGSRLGPARPPRRAPDAACAVRVWWGMSDGAAVSRRRSCTRTWSMWMSPQRASRRWAPRLWRREQLRSHSQRARGVRFAAFWRGPAAGVRRRGR